jgi:hypothetical protein
MKIVYPLSLLLIAALTPGCGSLSQMSSNVKEGALLGGAAGAVTGGVIGSSCGGSSSTIGGIIIGGGVGAIAGGLVGAMKDHGHSDSTAVAADGASLSVQDRATINALYHVEMKRYEMDPPYAESVAYQEIPRHRVNCVVCDRPTVYCMAPYPVVPEAYPDYAASPYGY